MQKNMSSADRVVRIGLALLAVVLYFANVISGTVAIVLLLVAGVFVLTSLSGFCPLYFPFGIRTNKKAKTQ